MKKIIIGCILAVALLAACTGGTQTPARHKIVPPPRFGFAFALGKLCPPVHKVDAITVGLRRGDVPVPLQGDTVQEQETIIQNEVPVYQMTDAVRSYVDILGRYTVAIQQRATERVVFEKTSEFWHDYDAARKALPC